MDVRIARCACWTSARPYKSRYWGCPCCNRRWIHPPMECSRRSEDHAQNRPGDSSRRGAPEPISHPCGLPPDWESAQWQIKQYRAKIPRPTSSSPESGGWPLVNAVSGAKPGNQMGPHQTRPQAAASPLPAWLQHPVRLTIRRPGSHP